MKRTILLGVGLGGLSLCVLSGCNQASIMKRMTPKEDEAISRHCVDELRQNKFDDIEREIDPGLKDSNLRSKLVSMATMFPAQEPISAKVVGFRASAGPVHRTEIILEYEFPDKWLLASVLTEKKGGVWTIAGFHVTPIEDSLENVNRFTLANKGASQYGILLLAVLAPVLSLYSLLRCIKADIGKRKWLWLIFNTARHRQAQRQLDNWTALFHAAGHPSASLRRKQSTVRSLVRVRLAAIGGNHISGSASGFIERI